MKDILIAMLITSFASCGTKQITYTFDSFILYDTATNKMYKNLELQLKHYEENLPSNLSEADRQMMVFNMQKQMQIPMIQKFDRIKEQARKEKGFDFLIDVAPVSNGYNQIIYSNPKYDLTNYILNKMNEAERVQ